MKELNILHIASFVGNVGDSASHLGLYQIFKILDIDFDVQQIEIRRIYKNYKRNDKIEFDLSFARHLNTFDLVMIGGGGFLDYWVEGSQTGTTIDISTEVLLEIHSPLLICSVGAYPHKVVPKGNREKFTRFLDMLRISNSSQILFRNDGSIDSLKNNFSDEIVDGFSEVLDNAFFYNPQSDKFSLPNSKYIAINITEDQLMMNSELRGSIELDTYFSDISNIVNFIVSQLDIDVVLVPHIHQDLHAIESVLERLDNFLVRTRVMVAGCFQGNYGAEYIFSVYQGAELVIGSRFHSVVVPLANSKKVIAFSALDRVSKLFTQFCLDEYSFVIGKNSFDDVNRAIKILLSDNDYIFKVSSILDMKRLSTLKVYRKSLDELCFYRDAN